MFKDPVYLKSDCRLVCRMLSLGVIPEEQMELLIKAGPRLAALAIETGKTRDWARVLQVLIAAARLEQDERRIQTGARGGDVHQHIHIERPPDQPRSQVARILDRLDPARRATVPGAGVAGDGAAEGGGNGEPGGSG